MNSTMTANYICRRIFVFLWQWLLTKDDWHWTRYKTEICFLMHVHIDFLMQDFVCSFLATSYNWRFVHTGCVGVRRVAVPCGTETTRPVWALPACSMCKYGVDAITQAAPAPAGGGGWPPQGAWLPRTPLAYRIRRWLCPPPLKLARLLASWHRRWRQGNEFGVNKPSFLTWMYCSHIELFKYSACENINRLHQNHEFMW